MQITISRLAGGLSYIRRLNTIIDNAKGQTKCQYVYKPCRLKDGQVWAILLTDVIR